MKRSTLPENACRVTVRMARSSRVLLLFLALLSLSPRPVPDSAQLPTLAYKVRIPTLEDRRIDVSLLVSGLDSASPLVLRAVPMYMDNPVAAADGPSVTGFRATDSSSGHPLSVMTREDKDGETLFEIADPGKTIRIDYQVRVRLKESDQTRDYAIRIPYMDRKQALLYGNYVFCYPELGKDKQESAALPLEIDVDFEPPDGSFFWGITRQFSVRTIYQLMSLQFGVGAYQADRLPPVGGTRLAVVYERSKDFGKREREVLGKVVAQAFEAVREMFGHAPLDHFSVLVFRDQAVGGMEGTFACQVFAPRDLDMANASTPRTRNFYSIVTHEIFHTWNPIAVYPQGDPWIKEGITGYYGEVLSVRAGLLTERDLASSFNYYERQLDRNDLMKKLTLTDPLIWQNEYLNEDWRTISYERGKAVALLLDLEIRKSTENRQSLDDVMRFLYREYNGKSYSHDEFVQAVTAATGADLSPFFRDYVAGTRVPSKKELESARKRIAKLGVYEAVEEAVR